MLEVITIVLLYDPFLYVFRCETEIFCANDNVNVLDKRDIPGFQSGERRRLDNMRCRAH